MKFFRKLKPEESLEEGLEQCRKYNEHMKLILPKLPPETRAFAHEDCYRDPNSHDCPHDGWLSKLEVTVEENEARRLNVRLELLGAYHDRLLTFRYSDVYGDWLHFSMYE